MPVLSAVALLIVLTGMAGGAYLWTTRLPSDEDDQYLIESALPHDADLPPGLIPVNSSDSSETDTRFCVHASRVPGERAAANVAFKATDPEKSGLFVGVFAYASDGEAQRAFLTAPTVLQCGKNKLDLTPVTGGLAEADESQTYSATTGGFGKLALTTARRGRFLVIGAGGTAQDALDWTKLTVGRL